ncbi:MAG: efflux RND transporter permease subunit [Prosthecobacter sp.]|jgi:CzcA family heavy metal efflux pump|uniref:efflux RND transporter permease subunit n=1 Tax=Prosthecobacter sp. TaxID=1965333 RepID=UPI001A0DDBC1|nr:efflux RND transporter permease subunit [Prosthecobacter sp.]MBE2283111.1 efflux RND transporter permease subunit [Prosthecobacter sp.]
MLNSIVTWALNMRVLVVAAAMALLCIGINATKNAPLDVFPEFAPPLVEVQTEAPGLSTEEVDSLVTVPLENSLNGLPFLKTIRSKSVLGLSSVVMIFNTGTDILKARQLVQERLNLAQNRLPAVVKPPVLMAPYSSLSRVLKVGLRSESLSQMQLSELAVWTMRPRLMAVPGVANVAIWGQRDRQFQVLVDPQKLRAAGVTLDAITRAAGDAAVISAGGFIDTPNIRLPVNQLSLITTADDLARTVVEFRNGAPIRLGDVAEVVEGNPPLIGDAVINDGDGILLIVEKQPWGNTLDVTVGVEKVLADMQPALPGVIIDSTIFRPATFIQLSIDHLTEALWLGCLLVVVVLALFLGDWRTTIISITAIPLSLAVALLLLAWRGETINTMILAGLIIALGEVVDDAIIDVENILRRLRQNAVAASPKSKLQVVLDASLEVRSAVVYASVIIVLVFVPVFFLPGLAGTFFKPLALSYILAITASLAVALTLTPALSLMLLKVKPGAHRDALLARGMKALYRGVLPLFARSPWLALLILLAAFTGTGWIWHTQLKEEFLPNFKERDFLMHWLEKPNTSVEASKRITIAAAHDLIQVPGVRNQGSHIGRAEVADEVVGPDFTELWISLDPDAPYDETIHKVQAVVDGYPGLTRDLLTFLRERIKEVLTGASASVVVRIFGSELDQLRTHSAEVGEALKDVPGVSALKVEPQVLVPQITVKLRPENAALHGLTAGQVRQAVTTLVSGRKVGEVYQQQRVHDVTVWSVPSSRADYTTLRELLIETPTGGHVRLADLADLAIVPTPNAIKREGASRRIDVTCNVATGQALGDVVREIEQRLGKITFARGYHPEILGEWAERQSAQSRLLWLSLASLAGILVLLLADFQSLRLTLLIALTLPFALIGGVMAAWLGGGVLSLGSLVGFVTVLGIAARNGILLISHYRHLQTEEAQPFGLDLILRGSEERLIPILMTAATAALALLPLVLKGDVPGNEIERPMALVILGGLATSTLLNLFLLPALYARFGKINPS